MSAAEEPVESKYPPDMELDDHTLLAMHRAMGLVALGFDMQTQVPLIVLVNDVVHTAEALLERGWPHDWIVEELTKE